MSGKPQLRGRAARLAALLPTRGSQAARTPFVLLVVALLGGGLITLLLLNSALSEGSFRLSDLRRETKALTDDEQALQRDVDAHAAPDALARRAQELGMVPGGDPAFLQPDGTVRGRPQAATGIPSPPAQASPSVSATAAATPVSPSGSGEPAASGPASPTAPGAAAGAATSSPDAASTDPSSLTPGR
ncbi:septum formation initiator family protein [Streptomyces fragilis]|uniref:Septum formation initiator family protein n=1 Tax=Streptomyces fragilis TaxID=67301 RepID=A0ABV2YC56_9ACTN|nr:septum formation initiator family protein [Streptomyces fragilis]